jgi:hypothetical protein
MTHQGRQPLFVSHVAKGNSETQVRYATALSAADRHLQWNQNIRAVHDTERSTRARSIVFFAFAAMAASALATSANPVAIFVPENGFISLNIPLNAGRVGSLSTSRVYGAPTKCLAGTWYTRQVSSPIPLQNKGRAHGGMPKPCLAGSTDRCIHKLWPIRVLQLHALWSMRSMSGSSRGVSEGWFT